ncbi:MAG: hypothetical protein KDM64_12955, partial [Verrucomicrobiae bacterium]|nr:hypothetical protein [Verrucomicrobiae bacterium]
TQLGHGGVFARSSRANNDVGARGLTGLISVVAGGDVLFTSGTLKANWFDIDDGRVYSQLGHGGYDADVRHDGGLQLRGTGLGHNGDITVSSGGSVIFQAGDETVNAPGATSGLGEGFGIIHYSQLGHGGYSAVGDHSGNITVTAADDIKFLGGSRTQDDSSDKRNYVILGHGGDESEGYNGARDANDNPTETIKVTATNGDIEFIAGEGRRNWAQLGNGGYSNNGDDVANIDVTAGGHIWFIGGQGSMAEQIIGEQSHYLNAATWAVDPTTGQMQGWVPLMRRDINVGAIDFTLTVDGVNYIANGSTFIEADADGRFTAAQIVQSGTGTVDGNGKLQGANVVGEIDLRTGHVRFTQDIDPNDTYAYGSTYNVSGWGSGTQNNASDNETTNPLLAQAMQGPAAFDGNSAHLAITFNDHRGGMTDVAESPLANVNNNVGIQAGSFSLEIPDGAVVTDDGAGNLVINGSASISDGTNVGTINYTIGQIVLTQAVNPNGLQGVKANYTTDRTVGADFAYAQLGNGGYDADHVGGGASNNDRSDVGDITVRSGGDIRFHGGNGVDAYTQLGNGGRANQGAHSGDILIMTDGAVEFLAGLGADDSDARAYAQLGHGGHDADGNHFGDITIKPWMGTGGSGIGSTAPGLAHIGDATASNPIGVFFKAGNQVEAYAQLGHGGYGSRSGTANSAAGAFGLNGDIVINTG